MRRTVTMLALAALLAGCVSAGRSGASSAQAQAGQRFAQRACAGCHAVGLQGLSRNPASPPFRTLAARLPSEALAAQLSSIAARGHVEMPPIYMTPDEIAAVAAYIRSVAKPEQDLGDNT